MNKLIRKVKRAFVKVPESGFSWSVEDFENAKKWAKAQDDPDNPKRSLWKKIYSPRKDSVDILSEINTYLKNSLEVENNS